MKPLKIAVTMVTYSAIQYYILNFIDLKKTFDTIDYSSIVKGTPWDETFLMLSILKI